MQVRDVMVTAIGCVSPRDTIQQVARLMKEEDTGFVPVVDGEKVVGAITDRDIVIRCLAEGHENPLGETVEHLMSREIETISPDDDLDAAASLMGVLQIRRLPVVEQGRLVGILSHGDLVQATQGGGPAQQATVGVTEETRGING